jgi:hypothetical protein
MLPRTWITEELEKNNYETTLVYADYNRFCRETGSIVDIDTFKRTVRKVHEKLRDTIDLRDYDDESVLRLEAGRQRLQDKTAVLRKSNREDYRLYNELEELYNENISLLKAVDLSKYKIKEFKDTSNKVMAIHLSDIHANELIKKSEAYNNAYDFIILSKRLKKLISRSIKIGKTEGIKSVHIFMTGDLLNSSRRLAEKLAETTALVSASLLITYLLQQAITELSKHFNVSVSSVVGNESRLDEDFEFNDVVLMQNYDYLVYNNLRMIFSNTPVKFIGNGLGPEIVKLSNGFQALLLHGNQFRTSNIQKEVNHFLQGYIYNGKTVHGVFSGHYHFSSCTGFANQCGSMCGGNAYSSNALGYFSKATQNIYLIDSKYSMDAITVDLQNVDNVEGYDIIKELERYQVRSN